MESASDTAAQSLAQTGANLGKESLFRLMEHLVLVREFEAKCESMWKAGEHMVGEYHLSLGQEAIAVGVRAATEPSGLTECHSDPSHT